MPAFCFLLHFDQKVFQKSLNVPPAIISTYDFKTFLETRFFKPSFYFLSTQEKNFPEENTFSCFSEAYSKNT